MSWKRVYPVLGGALFGAFTIAMMSALSFGLDLLVPGTSVAAPVHGPALAELVIGGVLVAPAIETALFQLLPLELIQERWPGRVGAAILVSALLFGLAHAVSGGPRKVFLMFVFGLLLASHYAVWAKQTRGRAFVATWAAHTANNLIAVLLLLAFPQYA